MAKKEKIQTLAEQWAAYLYLKKETKLWIPAMDAMRHAAAIRMSEYLHRKKLPVKRNASRKKDVPGEQFFGIPLPGKAYQRAGAVFTPECRELPVFMEPDAQRFQDNRQLPNTGSVQKEL